MAKVQVSPSRPAPRLLTSLRMQALEYRDRGLLLLIVLGLPVVFFAATYYTAPDVAAPVPTRVPERTGTVEVYLQARETWPMVVGIMGVEWGVATVAFFAVMGNLQRDRRLVLSGYSAWQILVARLGILAGISVLLAFPAMVPYTVVTSSLHPELVWLANFLGGLIAAGFGLLVGTLLPRPTEGMLIVLLVIGVGVSLGQDAARYFFTYPAQQLLTVGRLAQDPWPFPFIWQSLLIAGGFVGLALALWWRRTRVVR
ncbi:MAG: hypothetical protein ACE5NC_04880 [Anaerolineae bacterium]